jgi:SAM-dependent methyltransferase
MTTAPLHANAAPDTVWDWRQFGAMLLGEVAGKDVLVLGRGAREEGLRLAQLGARITVVDFADLPTSFQDDSFDRVHGIDILGRAGAEPALAEVRRLLRPRGVGVFLERIARRPGEDPALLTWAELRAATLRFASAALYPYHLMSRVHRFVPPSWRDTARRLDFGMLAAAPGLGRFAGSAVIRVIK